MSDNPAPTLTPEQKRELLARLLRERRDQPVAFPLSHGQRALFVLYRVQPESAAYNVAFTATLRADVDVANLQRALGAVMERHEILRITVADADGTPVQRVAPPADVAIEEIDASAWSTDELRRQLQDGYRRPFALEQGPVFRVSLFHRSSLEHVLLFVVHHIAVDAWSLGLLVSEWMESYAALRQGTPSTSPRPAARYQDFVRWQEELLAGSAGDEMRAYWGEKLRGAPASLALPADRPRPAVLSFRGGTHEFRIDEATTAALRQLARDRGTTLFVVLLAAFDVLLSRYSGQHDILVGSPTAGRSRQEFEGVVGYFVNPVVLRADLSGDPTFVELVERTRSTVIAALKHADFPFPLVVQSVNPGRDTSRSPLFQAEFNLVKLQQLGVGEAAAEGDGVAAGRLGGMWMETFALPQQEGQFDLTFEAVDLGRSLLANLKYATDLFEASTIERAAGHLRTLLSGAAARPTARISALPLLTEGERASQRHWNATQRDYALDRQLHQLVEAQVERTPEAVAVRAEGGQISYRDLDERSNRLAHHLRRLGVGAESLVGVSMERSIELVVALLGILKAGGAYVPLDPSYPSERLAFMLEDARVPVLLTQQHVAGKLPPGRARLLALDASWPEIEAESAARPEPAGTSANLAYVIYTSGSTGKPKGAMNAHVGIVNRLLWMQEAYGLRADDVVLQKTPFSFDVSVWEFFWPLISGARLVMARPEGHKDPGYLVQTIAGEGVTTIHFVPPMLQAFLEEPRLERCGALRRVICSGEALPAELCARFFERLDCELHNLYGPTEAAVDVTYFACRRGDPRASIPIGRPVANTRVHVLDRDLEPVPVGVAGELHLGGVQVGRGYLGRPQLTAERFIPDPFDAGGGRLYKTGDLARLLPDGNVEYLGRLDHQVKIRGFRIELGEIEAAIARHPGIRETVVLAREDRPGDRRLVAYAVSDGSPASLREELRSRLRSELPDHMVPSSFVFLPALPLSPNGKIDRKALPQPDDSRPAAGQAHAAPETAMEERLGAIWASVLGRTGVGVEDNFFDIGGNSLLLLRAVAQARQEGVAMEPLDMFRFPTVRALAARMAGSASGVPDYTGVRNRAQLQREALARERKVPRRS